jgi:hypothetical protein
MRWLGWCLSSAKDRGYHYLGLNNFPLLLKHVPRGAHVSPFILSLD